MKHKDLDRRVLLAGLGGAVAGSLLSSKAVAGPLNPPGPGVGSTGVSVQQLADRICRTPQGFGENCIPVESCGGSATSTFEIVTEGSYYLAGPIHGDPNLDVITVRVPNVDLDLCGYTITAGGSGTPGGGVAIRCDQENFYVYDGSIHGGNVGIDLSLASRSCVWDVTVLSCGSVGIVFGSRSLGYDCEVHNCPVAYLLGGERTELEESSAVTCAVGVRVLGTLNMIIANSATECQLPFDIGPGNAHGKIVVVSGMGDMSVIPGANVPTTNFIF